VVGGQGSVLRNARSATLRLDARVWNGQAIECGVVALARAAHRVKPSSYSLSGVDVQPGNPCDTRSSSSLSVRQRAERSRLGLVRLDARPCAGAPARGFITAGCVRRWQKFPATMRSTVRPALSSRHNGSRYLVGADNFSHLELEAAIIASPGLLERVARYGEASPCPPACFRRHGKAALAPAEIVNTAGRWRARRVHHHAS